LTKAVVAICVVFVAVEAVGAVGVPVRAGEAKGAKPEIEAPAGMVTVPVKVGEARFALVLRPFVTKAVVASCVVLVPAVAVGAAGVPVKVGEAIGALRTSTAVTKAVVASWVVLVPAVAVGAVGVPVRAGEASGALRSSAVWRSVCELSVPVMAPQVVEVTGVTPPTLTTQAAYVPDPVWWFTSTVITPVPELYVSTSPCIWFDASKEIVTFCVGVYESPVPTVRVLVALLIVSDVVEVVRYRSPGIMVDQVVS
jgi:hypothetical protein